MLGVILLYVGAVLFVNGVWLWGQAREPELQPAAGGHPRAPASYMLENREIAVLNFFTGGLGVVIAIIALVQGVRNEDIPSFALAGFVLLFAFTYLWVALNQFLGVSGRGLGWYCLFVACTAVPTGIITLIDADPLDIFAMWLGAAWLAWAVLWFLFYLLLGRGAPVLKLTAAVTIFEAVATAWAFGYVLLTERIPGL